MPAVRTDSRLGQIRSAWAQLIFAIILVGLVGLTGRIAYINVVHGQELRRRATLQHTGFRPALAQRGSIYDRRGRILAGSCLTESLFADPAIIQNKAQAAELVKTVTAEPAANILQLLQEKPDLRFLWLARDIRAEQVVIFNQADRRNRRGLGLRSEPKRIYPEQMLAGHLLGAVSIDGRGLEGLELFYNDLLAGHEGRERFVRDAARRKIWLIGSDYKPPRNGTSIILTLDAVIQELTEQYLNETCLKFRAETGTAIVMDPRTGDVLAWACWPAIDPNRFGDYPVDRRRNHGITDPFEPGSVFKPFIALAALKHGVVDWNEKIFCHEGEYRAVSGRRLRDSHGHGELSFSGIVIKSSNIGMAILGERLGNDRLYDAVRAFGFGRQTGIDLGGESAGIVRPRKVWDHYTTTSIPMGQEISVTAIQLITAFAALANDGVILKPRLLRAVLDESGRVVRKNFKPKIVGRAIESDLARAMVTKILTRVVAEGTGTRAAIPGYRVFGKTGTAQIAVNGRYNRRDYVGSFLGGAPASSPKVVVLVTVRKPDRRIGYYGGTVAAPVVKKILENTLKYLGIPPVESEEPAEKIPVTVG